MDLEKVSLEIYRVLKKGGLALLSIPVEESLKRLLFSWQKAYQEVFNEEDILFRFPKEETIVESFKNSGLKLLEFERKEFVAFFDSPKEAVKCVNGIGAKNPFRKGKVSKKLIQKFYELFSENGRFPINYKVLFLTLKKT
jgi:malonyl-CoA O-methyltransferase